MGLNPMDIEVRPVRETPGFLQIYIPEELASVEEVYEAPAKLDPRLILHIQTAHGNYHAQKQIQKLLEYLHETYGFSLFFIEGAAERLNPDYLKLFPEDEKNEEVIDYFARRGQATGADLFLMSSRGEIQAVGIEDPELYRGNYEAFKTVHLGLPEAEYFLTEFSSKLDILSSRYFNSETRRMLSEWSKFQEGSREFLPYIRNLAADAKKIIGVDLESLFSQLEWPQITRLMAIQAMESELDRDKGLEEKKQLVQFLKEKGVSEALIRGLETLEEKRIYINRMNAGKSTDDSMVPRHLLERLLEEAGPKGFSFQDYPAFSLYSGYLILQSELDSRPLFEEIERLFQKILDELTVSEQEQDLLELFRDAELLKSLFHLEVTRKQWARAFYRIDWIRPDAMVKRIRTVQERGSMAGGHQFQNPVDISLRSDVGQVTRVFDAAFQFYEYARKREAQFHLRIKQEMNRQNREKAVLITGGFHTDGLMELFRQEEISYGVLTPRMATAEGREQYIHSMMQSHPSMFDLANLEVFDLLQSSDMQGQLGAVQEEVLKDRVEAFFALAEFRNLEQAEFQINHFNENVGNRGLIELNFTADRSGIAISFKGQPVVTENGERIIVPIIQDPKDPGSGVLKPASHFKRGDLVPGVASGLQAPVRGPLLTDTLPGEDSDSTYWAEGGEIPVIQANEGKMLAAIQDLLGIIDRADEESIVEADSDPEVDLQGIENVTRLPLGLSVLDQLALSAIQEADAGWNSLIVTLLVNGIFGPGAANSASLSAIADTFKNVNAPVKSEAVATNPAIDFDFQAGVANLVLERNRVLTAEQIVLLGDLLQPDANKFVHLNLLIPADDMEMVQAGLDQARAEALRIWEERWEGLLDEASQEERRADLESRLNFIVTQDLNLGRNLIKAANDGGNAVYAQARKRGAPVSRSVIADEMTAVLYATALQGFVPEYRIRGHKGEFEMALSENEELLAMATAVVLLAVFRGDPETINERTLAALQQLDELSKQWGIDPEQWSQFSGAVKRALISLQGRLRAAASA